MGCNGEGQLGVNDQAVESKNSPVLVDSLLNYKPLEVTCGAHHTIVRTKTGECFAWGLNDQGQCGTRGGN